MKRHVLGVSAACIAICLSGVVARAQQNQFPLAAPAGVDSKAEEVAPPSAVNQGPFDMMAAVARGVKMELGEHADTQGKPEIGPFVAARTR
jgi:hypothetical protein